MTGAIKKADLKETEIIQKIESTEVSAEERNQFLEALEGWHSFVDWLKAQRKPDIILKCMVVEIENKARSHYIDRLRTKYNKQKALYDLRLLEQYLGQVISINHIGKRG